MIRLPAGSPVRLDPFQANVSCITPGSTRWPQGVAEEPQAAGRERPLSHDFFCLVVVLCYCAGRRERGAALVGRSGRSGRAGWRGSAAGARHAHHAGTGHTPPVWEMSMHASNVYQSAWTAVPLCSVTILPLANHAGAADISGQFSVVSCQCLAMPAGVS